jgi:N-methylhydantoinase A
MRYVGQAYELTVAASGDFVGAFHGEHEQRYGYSDPGRAVEVVNVRVRVIGVTARIEWPRQRLGTSECKSAIATRRKIYFGSEAHETPIYARERLHAGNRLAGPAVISEYSATTVVPPKWQARVDEFENLVLSSGAAGAARRTKGN